MTAAANTVPNTFAFSDAVVFGRVSDRVVSYWNRFIDEAPACPEKAGIVERAIFGARDYFAKRATVRQLERLNDRMLQDIGLTRGDLVTFG